jgi:beta-N-acetylhexosaminidase
MKRLLILLIILLVSCEDATNFTEPSYTLPDETVVVRLDPFFNDGLYDIKTHKKVEESWLDKMSLEDKIAQLFILDFRSIVDYPVTEMDGKIEAFMNTYPIGGIIYFSENVDSYNQVKSLNDSLQEISRYPLIISVDEEGGKVSRIGKAGIGVDHLQSARSLASKDEEHMLSLISKLAVDLHALGFNLNFAPVLDVDTNPNNPVIGNRSFSSDPEIVGDLSLIYMKAMHDQGVATVGKHFPGHGDTNSDSHYGTVYYMGNYDEFMAIEAVPFIKAIEEKVPLIMLGHITAPNLDDSGLPASLSTRMIDILKEDLNYKGLIITDSMRMKAITDLYSPVEIGPMALLSGIDLILMPEDFETTYNAIIKAVHTGDVSEHRINQILIKKKYLWNLK